MIRPALLTAVLILGSAAFTFPQSIPSKKNSRPPDAVKAAAKPPVRDLVPEFVYEFENPKFVVSRIRIEHDGAGNGKLTFRKKDFEEDVTEPFRLSERTQADLNELWEKVDYLRSESNYQSEERDYAHLGTVTLQVDRGGIDRKAVFNWTEDPAAKKLADEYRKVGNQVIWKFDINVARENQPLETPRIMDKLDLYIRQSRIADPVQLLPFLKALEDDERLPLIARNHAGRIIARIEKKAKDR